jgi:DNA-binding transcriptional LysR family regulator
MDLRLLEVFCRVYRERSFSRAARDLGLTQPTVSVHIKDLERSLGTPVFERLGREIRPTEAGRFLYEHAQGIFALKQRLAEKMAAFLNSMEGELTVGASSVPGEYLLPSLLVAFRERHPGARVRLRISDTGETIEDLRRGDVELGVVGDAIADHDLVFEPLATDELILVVPPSGPWTRARILARELPKLPLIVRELGSGTRKSLEQALRGVKLELADLNVIAELGSLGAVKEAVKAGYGVAFLSKLTIASELKRGALRRAQVPELGTIERAYDTVRHRERVLSPLTRAFIEHLARRPPREPNRRRAVTSR